MNTSGKLWNIPIKHVLYDYVVNIILNYFDIIYTYKSAMVTLSQLSNRKRGSEPGSILF